MSEASSAFTKLVEKLDSRGIAAEASAGNIDVAGSFASAGAAMAATVPRRLYRK